MERLLAGYERFRATRWRDQRPLYEQLAVEGQSPSALVIACVDSRVDPSVIFDAAPGELLTVRNVANLVPPYEPDAAYHGTSAALEFGIRVLGIGQVIVLGHGMCGGIRALLEGAPADAQDFVAPWMSIAKAARHTALACDEPLARQRCCEHEAIRTSLANLMGYPWIAERVAADTLRLDGAWFSIHDGELLVLDAGGTFVTAGMPARQGAMRPEAQRA